MFRGGLIDLLLDNPMSVAEIAREHKMQIKEVATDLEHLRKSLRHSGHSLEVTLARCRKCRFEFGPEKLTNLPGVPNAAQRGSASHACRCGGVEKPQVRAKCLTSGQAFWRCRHGYSLVGYYRN